MERASGCLDTCRLRRSGTSARGGRHAVSCLSLWQRGVEDTVHAVQSCLPRAHLLLWAGGCCLQPPTVDADQSARHAHLLAAPPYHLLYTCSTMGLFPPAPSLIGPRPYCTARLLPQGPCVSWLRAAGPPQIQSTSAFLPMPSKRIKPRRRPPCRMHRRAIHPL